MKTQQYFNTFDLVHIAKDLGEGMSHFPNDIDAIVLYSYAQRFGRTDNMVYCLLIKGKGTISWYHQSQLTLIEKNQEALADEWAKKLKLRKYVDYVE